MKIEIVKLALSNPLIVDKERAIQGHENDIQLNELEQNLSFPKKNNLLEEILTIQNLKNKMGIESLAANDLDSWFPSSRIGKANWMGRAPYNPDDLSTLEQRLKKELNPDVMVAITNAMVSIIQGIDSERIPNIYYRESNLMKTALDIAVQQSSPPYTFSCGSSTARNNAAYALRLIVGKMREARLGLSDETDIIKYLLGSSSGVVRSYGVDAATTTYKDGWRKNIQDIGLITAFKREDDDSIRQRIAYTIALTSPQSILESHVTDSASEKFRPITRMLNDRSYGVRRNLLWGLTQVFVAQKQEGSYYKDFHEIPELTPRNRVDSFDFCLRNIETLCGEVSPSKDKLEMLHNSCYVVFYSCDNDAIKNIKAAGLQPDYEKIEKRMLKLDVVKFINLTTPPIDNPDLNTWDLAYRPVERILNDRSKTHNKPLVYFFQLKNNIQQKLGLTTEPFTINNLKDVIEKINSCTINYLSSTPFEKIKWGERQDFNFVINNFLEILESSTNSSHQTTMLNSFELANQNKIRLDGLGSVSLQEALDNATWLRLNKTLATIVHSSKLTKSFLTTPSSNSLEGKALILYREISMSFKDYYGMRDLKERSIGLALDGLQGNPRGLLLSGTAGTGKSLFGKVLANELALPLIILETNKLKEGEPGNIIFQEGTIKLTLDQYLNSLIQQIKTDGACVLLIDEIEKIASPDKPKSASSLIQFFQKLKLNNCKVVIIATTNYPTAESIVRIPINNIGESNEINTILSQTISPVIFKDLHPCYLFHERSVGANFTKEYLPALSRSGKFQGEIDLQMAAKLSTGLSPASLTFSKISTLDQRTLIQELKKLKADNDYYIGHLSRNLRTKIDDLVINETHIIDGELDYFELALAAEMIPLKAIASLLSDSPATLNQTLLINLFSNYYINNTELDVSNIWKRIGRNPDLPYSSFSIFLHEQAKLLHTQVKYLNKITIENLVSILADLHTHFITNKIWREDTKKHSKRFEELPANMKLNYFILFASANISYLKNKDIDNVEIQNNYKDTIKHWFSTDIANKLGIHHESEWSLASKTLLAQIDA